LPWIDGKGAIEMPQNHGPYGFQPQHFGSAPRGNSPQGTFPNPRSALIYVRIPAIILSILSVLWMLLLIPGIGYATYWVVQWEIEIEEELKTRYLRSIATGVVLTIAQVIVLFGAYYLIRGGDRSSAKMGGWVAMIPIIGSPFIVLGMPFALWALIAMDAPSVRRFYKS
jgi:hypothetical protein